MNKRASSAAVLAVSAALAVAMAAVLPGCGSLSEVRDDGTTERPVFPELADARFDQRQGTYPDARDIAVLLPGMTKDQLYTRLGRPHFSEGFRVREWDYLLYSAKTGTSAPCQLKVLFDKNMLARSYLWRPAGCGAGL